MNHRAFEAVLAEIKAISAEMRKLTKRDLEKVAAMEKRLGS